MSSKSMIDDNFDLDDCEREVTRIPQNQNAQNQLGKGILQNAEQYLQQMSAGEHTHLIQALGQHAQVDAYLDVLKDDLDQPTDAKFANDALNLIHIWSLVNQHEDDVASFNFLDVINTGYFQTELLQAFDALQIDSGNKAQRRLVIEEVFKLYQSQCFAGCILLLYAQLEGLLTDVLIEHGFLKQNQSKFVDVYKIVPGLKGHEIKSLWHKAKIAYEMNVYFAEINAYKMDNSSTVTMTRHNILHGTDVSHFSKERSFILFIWLFSVVSFMSTLRR